MNNHLWFMGERGCGKTTMARQLQAEGPADARFLSGRTTPAFLANILTKVRPPSLVIIDIDDEADAKSWATILYNATAAGGHMVFGKGRDRYRFKVPDGCQIAVFSPPLSDALVARLSSGRGCFQFSVIGQLTRGLDAQAVFYSGGRQIGKGEAIIHLSEGPETAATITAATNSDE